MRSLAVLLALPLLAPALRAEEGQNPFGGELRKAADEDGVVSITVPKRWVDRDRGADCIIHVYAAGGGGHDVLVTREGGQGDIDALRDRYLKHDTGRFAGAVVQKISEPYFGYRLDSEEQKLVVLRAFATQGGVGIILSITSRIENYDRYYKDKLAWVASTLSVNGARTGGFSNSGSLSGLPERHWDKTGGVSIVAPGGWKPVELEGDEVLLVARRGRSGEPRLFVNKWIGAESASLAITKIAREWKQNYKTARFERLEGEPPRMIVQGRDGDWVDYFIAAFDGKVGWTVRLTARRGGFDDLRAAADAAAQSLAFMDAPYYPPEPPALDLAKEYKKLLRFTAKAEQAGAIDDVGKTFESFLKVWGKVGIEYDRRAEPLSVILSSDAAFGEMSNHFGAAPAAYDRSRRCVVATPPPAEKPDAWRGAIYAAFAEALLHRDLKVAAPPWFRRGFCSCLRAAGLSDGDPEAEVPEFVGRLQLRVGGNLPEPTASLWQWTDADYRADETLDKPAHAWGYVHRMVFGKGALATTYKKWVKALAKARNTAPPFQLKKPEDARAELADYIAKHWSARD